MFVIQNFSRFLQISCDSSYNERNIQLQLLKCPKKNRREYTINVSSQINHYWTHLQWSCSVAVFGKPLTKECWTKNGSYENSWTRKRIKNLLGCIHFAVMRWHVLITSETESMKSMSSLTRLWFKMENVIIWMACEHFHNF